MTKKEAIHLRLGTLIYIKKFPKNLAEYPPGYYRVVRHWNCAGKGRYVTCSDDRNDVYIAVARPDGTKLGKAVTQKYARLTTPTERVLFD